MDKIADLKKLKDQKDAAEREFKIAGQRVQILKNEKKRLTRSQRTHRLCSHGGLLECFLSPEDYSDEQMEVILKTIFQWKETKALLKSIQNEAGSTQSL